MRSFVAHTTCTYNFAWECLVANNFMVEVAISRLGICPGSYHRIPTRANSCAGRIGHTSSAFSPPRRSCAGGGMEEVAIFRTKARRCLKWTRMVPSAK